MSCKDIIRKGNIVTTEYNEADITGRYLANGRFGAVLGGLGLNMSIKGENIGASQFTHLNHWGRFKFFSDNMKNDTTADYILPLFKMQWEEEPKKVTNYKQVQDFYDGTLETLFTTENNTDIRVLSWFDMVNKNLFGTRIEVSGEAVSVKAFGITDFIPYAYLYKTETKQQVSVKQVGDNYCLTVGCSTTVNNRSSRVYFYTNAPVEICENGICIVAKATTDIFVSYGEPINKNDCVDSLSRTVKLWNEKWEKGGWFDFPDASAHKTWVRSNAYLISSYDDDLGPIQPTNGLTGNLFHFHFVQDMEYISPALMMLGNAHIVKRWVEKFAGEIEAMKKYAKRLWSDAKGIYPPWELPFGEIEGYHYPSVPIVYCYEPHNAGYLCRMAKEAADFAGDLEWAKKYAYPLITEVGEFFKAFAKKQDDGKWHLHWYPCIGQDEAGGRNKSDYLCCMYSAQYTFKTVVECGLDNDGSIAEILADGLAFDSLMSERGIYHTCHGADDFGKQKHPVQLDGLAYFPIEEAPLKHEELAYNARLDITADAKQPYFYGWTLSELLLSGSNIKNKEGWKSDWELMRASDYTDPLWVQIYETSGEAFKSFYITNHGMILQSLIRNYVNDYWGGIDIAACPVFSGDVSFNNIETKFGVLVSGTVKNGAVNAKLKAKKDCEVKVNGKLVRLEKDNTINMEWNI